MKKTVFILLLFLTFNSFAQKSTSHYMKVYDYDEFHKDWALVKNIAGAYGFIDRNGNEVVQAVYSKIYKFEEKKDQNNYDMIKNIAGAYGFIDEQGKEIVPPIFWKKEEAIQKLDIFINTK
jgi:hypothetical protein